MFYSEKEKNIVYTNLRENFVLESEFDYNEKFVNFKENKSFINNLSVSNFKKDSKKPLYSVWFDEDEYLLNKDFLEEISA